MKNLHFSFAVLFLVSLITFSLPGVAQESSNKRGIQLELSAGYPEMRLGESTGTAIYNGQALQGNLIFPFASGDSYSFDLDLSYTIQNLENNASSSASSEWSQYKGLGAGLRFRFSYFEAGIAYHDFNGRHLRSGSSSSQGNGLFESSASPIIWKVGFQVPLSANTAVGIGYSKNLNTDMTLDNAQIPFQNQTLWFRIQIDFGLSFLNLLKVEESFESTRGSFFTM